MIKRGEIAAFTIRIAGYAAPEEFMAAVTQVVVDTNLYLPDMFTITLHDKDLVWIDSERFAVGTEVEILAKAQDNPASARTRDVRLIKGEVTALEPDFAATGEATVVIRGYDRSHRLRRGTKTRSFLRSTDSEVARKIAQELQLQAEVDPTPTVHDYIFQNNQTDLEFLTARANRIGYQVYVDDRTLHFKRGDRARGEGPDLNWRSNLYSFRPRLTVVQQVGEVTVRGWDPAGKREIIGRATKGQTEPRIGWPQSGSEMAQVAFQRPAQAVMVDRPVTNLDEANAMAQALMDELSGEFVQAEGLCLGDPQVAAGVMVNIGGLGDRFSGRYFVTMATHVLNDGKYDTSFSISGRQPNTLSYLVGAGNGHQGARELVKGVVIGVVTNARDPENLGRVKVRYPWLADNEESPWVRVSQSGGMVSLPDVNQEVLVAFEHGDIHHPYVLGTLWNGRDRPPDNGQAVGRDGKVARRSLRSRTGHEVTLDDTDDKASIIIRDRSGTNEIVIDSIKNNVSIKVKGDFTIEAGGKIEMVSRNNLSIEAKGRGEIKSNSLTLDGGPKLDAKGGQINLN